MKEDDPILRLKNYKQICPGAYMRIKTEPERTIDYLREINRRLQQLDVLQLIPRADSTSALMPLENCTGRTQNVIAATEKGVCDMAYQRMRICVGHNDDGSPVIKQISGNNELELADKIVSAMLQSERRNEFIPPVGFVPAADVPTFQEYAETWLQLYKIGKLKPTSIAGYKALLNGHLYPAFGNTTLDKISTRTIQGFLDERKDKAAKYLREMKTLLSSILECAKRDKLIADNPATDSRLIIPSDKCEERKALTGEDVKDIIENLDKLNEQDKLFLALLIFTGARRGEILGLQWQDIDLSANVIHICRNATYAKNQAVVGTPKTKSGFRDVPLLPDLIQYLLPSKGCGYVIGGAEKPISLIAFRRMWERIEKTINLHGATPHVFRHTMGTLLNDVGADVKTIQGVLGQRDFKTTADRYIHSRDEKKQEAALMVSNLLQKAS